MKLKKLGDNIFLFTAKTQKELTLSFFRMQEFYESPLEQLKGKEFNTFEFIDALMNDKGKITYFSDWYGFNIPGNIVNKWIRKQSLNDYTIYEEKMFNQLDEAGIDYDSYYIIGSLKTDKNTIKHEIAHALYYTNKNYRSEMQKLNKELEKCYSDHYLLMKECLLRMGYCKEVIDDEIQAYLSSEKKKYLIKEFDIEFDEMKLIIKEYRKVLLKYNKFDF